MNRKTKLTQDVRQQLVAVYLKSGMKGVAELAAHYGVKPKSVANMASTMGLLREVPLGRASQTENDKRWA